LPPEWVSGFIGDKGEDSVSVPDRLPVKRTADPSASLGMTKERATFQ
jgi:hypothetical protein